MLIIRTGKVARQVAFPVIGDALGSDVDWLKRPEGGVGSRFHGPCMAHMYMGLLTSLQGE